jgi:hypothetical protein
VRAEYQKQIGLCPRLGDKRVEVLLHLFLNLALHRVSGKLKKPVTLTRGKKTGTGKKPVLMFCGMYKSLVCRA